MGPCGGLEPCSSHGGGILKLENWLIIDNSTKRIDQTLDQVLEFIIT